MRNLCFNILRRNFSSKPPTIKVSIVGGGPAGFYAAQHLAKTLKPAEIDIFERLPVPFGLVRFGVAPDHPEVKNVINTFTKTAENPSVRYIGNVNLGKDISLKTLQQAYDVVLLTYGAEENRKLNIPGEDLTNVLPARRIVGWYNGVPEDANLKIDLSGPSVAIFGQGNVAIDVARILLTPVDILKSTDITDHALQALSTSKVKEVYLIGRRGPLQAAFTIKELREMLKLENSKTMWNPGDFANVPDIIPSLARPRKRITELMLKSLNEKLLGDGFIQKVSLGFNTLVGDDVLDKKALLTGEKEILNCNLAVTSIGYSAVQADKDIPFDSAKGVIKNTKGKIADGLYTTGWVATGPTGVIVTTMTNAFTTADLICREVKELTENKPGFEAIKGELNKSNVPTVSWSDWLKIDAFEQMEGRKLGKPREKILTVKKMLEIIS